MAAEWWYSGGRMTAQIGGQMQIDLKSGVAPISYVASRLAALIKQAAKSDGPIIITQKGRPTGVLLSVEAYTRLVERGETGIQGGPVPVNIYGDLSDYA